MAKLTSEPKYLPHEILENQFVNLLNWLEKLSYIQLQRLEFEVKELLEELEELRAKHKRMPQNFERRKN